MISAQLRQLCMSLELVKGRGSVLESALEVIVPTRWRPSAQLRSQIAALKPSGTRRAPETNFLSGETNV